MPTGPRGSVLEAFRKPEREPKHKEPLKVEAVWQSNWSHEVVVGLGVEDKPEHSTTYLKPLDTFFLFGQSPECIKGLSWLPARLLHPLSQRSCLLI